MTGKQHRNDDFLGMKIKLRKDKLAELSKTKELKEANEMFESTCVYAIKTPGTPNLWEVNENAERLDTRETKIFHSVPAELSYVVNRTRPDTEPEVAYFTT